MKTWIFVIVITLCPLFPRFAAAEKISGRFYKENYGTVTASKNKLAATALSVFEKLREAAAIKKPAELIILPKRAERWEKWIGTLADGGVVMVESVLELCFESGEPSAAGEARLAFILGHELSHLSHSDHMKKLPAPKLLFMSGKKTKANSYDDLEEFEKMEEQADFSGLIFMTMAGFDPKHITDKDSFFRQYQDKIRKRGLIADNSYPGAEERNESLKNKIVKMTEKTELFYRGLKKYRDGLYSESIELFKEFAKIFPAREVWNNIGLGRYQLAMKDLALLDKKRLMKFRLSTVVAPETLASKLIYKGEVTTTEQNVYKKLNEAEAAFRLAIKLDSDYLPARINLSSVLIRLKQYEKALEELDEALAMNSGSLACLLNKAAALYLSDKEGHWAEARKILERRIPLSSQYYSQALYNSNIIQEERLRCASKSWTERAKVCKPLWGGFFRLEPAGPYARMIESEYKYKEKRIALVIGNSAYSKAYLNTPLQDAAGVASTLHDLGFEVHLRQNVDREEMKKAIWSFGRRIKQGGTGLFYYSGHGVQIEGKNYLVPLNAEIVVPKQADLEFIRADEVLVQMEASENRLNIVLLDACRNNPFSGFKSGAKGLGAPSDVPKGTIIGYATAPGGVALGVSQDGYSPYTKELLEYMKTPGLKIEDMFKKVRRAVAEKTNGLQKPWETTSLEGDFYFNPWREGKLKIIDFKQTKSKSVVYQRVETPYDYSWAWHTAAVGLSAASLYTAYQADREYKRLDQENKDLKNSYENGNIKAAQRGLMEDEHDDNEQKMKAEHVRLLAAGSIAVAALAWEIYLILKSDDRTKTALKSNKFRYAVAPDPSGNIKVSLNWRF